MARFIWHTPLACSPRELYDFLAQPRNVARISDPTTGLNFVEAPEIVQTGSLIRFEIISFGQVQKAEHLIEEATPHQRIVEVQTEGPTKHWRHVHLFVPDKDGCRMTDEIEFDPPGGLLGFIATEERITATLEDNFYYRQQQLERLVAAGALR